MAVLGCAHPVLQMSCVLASINTHPSLLLVALLAAVAAGILIRNMGPLTAYHGFWLGLLLLMSFLPYTLTSTLFVTLVKCFISECFNCLGWWLLDDFTVVWVSH